MDKRKFAFEITNYILLLAGVLIIIVGFILMCGPSTTMTHFESDIFSVRRIKVAPTVCFFGFLFVIYSILHRSKGDKKDNE